jgi:signal transduction histidine kinase
MKKTRILKTLPFICLVLSILFLALSMARSPIGDVEKIADKTESKLAARMEILDTYIRKALETEEGSWPEIGKLPDDMVIYRYVNDSLQSWSNQFAVLNDDISSKLVFQRMSNMMDRIVSPLSEIEETVSYRTIGPIWYVTKSVSGTRNDRIIAGLEVKNTLIDGIRTNENGVNKALKLPNIYSIQPLGYNGGADVSIDGVPLFKVLCETIVPYGFFNNSVLKWISLILFALATILLLASRRTIKVFMGVLASLGVMAVVSFFWAQKMNESMDLFSPTIYADGQYLNSLGVLILTNSFITMLCICLYLIRDRFVALARADRERTRTKMAAYGLAILTTGICIFAYTHITLKSLIMNSNISLELYRLNDNIRYTVLVYLSYTGLFFCLLLHIQALRPVVKRFFGISYNILSRWGILLFALICAFYFTCTSSTLGFRKEVDRVTVWANRLAVDRNLALEIQLRSVEESIANDQLLSALSMLENTAGMLQNRISDNYLSRIRQDNSITVHVYKEDDKTGTENFNTITRSGTPISEGSRFFFLTDGNGRSTYAGTFFFWNKEHGLVRMLLMVEPNSNREDRGYYSILGRFSKPGEINIPSFYSYAKYIDDRLVSYKGNFPYPTVSFVSGNSRLASEDSHVLRMKDNVHFVNMVSENEVIVISRKQRSATAYFTSFSYLFLMIYAILFLFVRQENKKQIFKKNFFRKRINTILFTSSLLILASMAVISVLFVYKRNEANMYDLMSTKINTIQALMETRVRQASSWQDLLHPDIISSLENIGNTTKSDITLYTPEGKVFHSTNPEVFEKQILGSRINEDAYKNIRYMHQRFFIHREKITDYRYWMLYAPVFNDNRQMIGIISTPYTDRNYDFRREAFSHAALLINLFLLLLIASLLLSTRELNRIFSPLVEMGKKMDKTDIHNPEYIIYKREDEISTIVDAYNRMQEDLAASTKMLASAERDKAWSEMARQVAHEIKNPLTPIKLEIQRLIRLKQKGNPAWEEKFDKVADVVLEHIDILTDTANEFSTFAKLYSEEPVLINLDKILKEQLLIFDNKENVKISYIGLEDAYVMAPKPQLIRVFVNLITNAIQAVEIHQKELMENEGEFISGKIFIGLRNSTKDGYYDIVFDDNGAGVKEENLDKLFTPNFTTKTGGTGLGLAISRNIITKCEGEISYRKSYALGGASFTVTLPKHQG